MAFTDLVPYFLAATPPSIIAVVAGADSPETLLAGAGSGAVSIIAVVAVRLMTAHTVHLEALRKRWGDEDRQRFEQRAHWRRSAQQSRDLHAAVGAVRAAVAREK